VLLAKQVVTAMFVTLLVTAAAVLSWLVAGFAFGWRGWAAPALTGFASASTAWTSPGCRWRRSGSTRWPPGD
jgi:ABC-2 type transport system permease protein